MALFVFFSPFFNHSTQSKYRSIDTCNTCCVHCAVYCCSFGAGALLRCSDHAANDGTIGNDSANKCFIQFSVVGFLWKNSKGHLRGRTHSAFREVREDLGPSIDDGSYDGAE